MEGCFTLVCRFFNQIHSFQCRGKMEFFRFYLSAEVSKDLLYLTLDPVRTLIYQENVWNLCVEALLWIHFPLGTWHAHTSIPFAKYHLSSQLIHTLKIQSIWLRFNWSWKAILDFPRFYRFWCWSIFKYTEKWSQERGNDQRAVVRDCQNIKARAVHENISHAWWHDKVLP